MTKQTLRRCELIKAMDLLICSLNDTDAMPLWLQEGPPDGYDENDLVELAEDDNLYRGCCIVFRELIKQYGDSGFYIWGDKKAF